MAKDEVLVTTEVTRVVICTEYFAANPVLILIVNLLKQGLIMGILTTERHVC